MNAPLRIALLGFGEVGQIFAADFAARGIGQITAWDVKFRDPVSAPSRALGRSAARAAGSAAEAVSGASIVISAVTAAQDVAAARAAAEGLARECFFLDLNSVSPAVKHEVAGVIDAAGARYVEAAVMAPVPPKRLATPMLLGGPHAAAFQREAAALGLTGTRVFAAELGRASAAKMCRSVMVKGIEALLAESLLTARYYGVEAEVLASLRDLFPVGDWERLARYMISRSLVHGTRRAEEMREVADTVAAAGITPSMSSASAVRQEWAAQYHEAAEAERLQELLDAVLASVRKRSAR